MPVVEPPRAAGTDRGDRLTGYLGHSAIRFHITGCRNRKVGPQGKHDEVFTLGVENDTVPKRTKNTPPTGSEPTAGRPTQYPFWLHR